MDDGLEATGHIEHQLGHRLTEPGLVLRGREDGNLEELSWVGGQHGQDTRWGSNRFHGFGPLGSAG